MKFPARSLSQSVGSGQRFGMTWYDLVCRRPGAASRRHQESADNSDGEREVKILDSLIFILLKWIGSDIRLEASWLD